MMTLKIILLLAATALGVGAYMENRQICNLMKAANIRMHCKVLEDGLAMWKSEEFSFHRDLQNNFLISCSQKANVDLRNFPALDLSDTRKLTISKCSIEDQNFLTNIRRIFNLTGVSHLIMEVSKNHTISSSLLHAFSNVSALEFVSQNNNFERDTFDGFNVLRTLRLVAHDISNIPHTLFTPLTSLEAVEIEITPKRKVVHDPMRDRKVFNVTLSNNWGLKSCSLRGIQWPIILDFDFRSVISEINITDTIIAGLERTFFGGTTQVENLILSGTHLQQIPENFFSSQGNLISLDLSRNKLKTIKNSSFVKNTELEKLDLSFNEIASMEIDAFQNLHFLASLNLNNNFLAIIELPTLFRHLLGLEKLFLRENKIRELNGELPANMTNLREIDLSGNPFTMFYVFKFWPKSSRDLSVRLSDNNIHGISFKNTVDTHELQKTLHIDLGIGPVTCNCHTIELHHRLHGVQVTDAVDTFVIVKPVDVHCRNISWGSVVSLNPLDVECPLDLSPHEALCPDKCDCNVRPVNKVTIKCANISHVPSMPPKRSMDLKKITDISLVIAGNSAVRSLPLADADNFNSITEIHAKDCRVSSLQLAQIPQNLHTLDLSNNQMRTLPGNLLDRLGKLRELRLSGNPWNCSMASTIELVRFVKNSRDTIVDKNMIRCANGEYFIAMRDEKECHMSVYVTVVLCLLTFLLVSVVFVLWRNRRAVIDWVYEKDHFHLMERLKNLMQPLDACIVCASSDSVIATNIGSKLINAPNSFKKCALIVKNWAANESIPERVLAGFRKSRRVIVILSEQFEEDNWTNKWSYSAIRSRVIFVTKSDCSADDIQLRNKFAISFGDPWFWEKLKNAMVSYEEMGMNNIVIELQPLTSV